jgi:hypothetical protein
MTLDELQPDETDLRGQWIVDGESVRGDQTENRIRWLIDHRLDRLGSDPSGWDTLFRDRRDGRLWELTYPQSELHGGGPCRLSVITAADAARKYDVHAV